MRDTESELAHMSGSNSGQYGCGCLTLLIMGCAIALIVGLVDWVGKWFGGYV